jgi:hypothetical protein
MRKAILFIMIIAVLAITCAEAHAFGVSPGRKQFDYQTQLDGQITIINTHGQSADLIIVARGELSEYVIFSDVTIKLQPSVHESKIHYTVRVPQDKLEMGPNQIDIFIMPISLFASESTVSAQAGIISSIIINVPYDGVYAMGRIDYNSREKTIIVPITNAGTERILSAKTSVTILGPTNDIVVSKVTDEKTIGIKETVEFMVPIAEVPQGNYLARATIEYDGRILVLERNIAIGQEKIAIQSIDMPEFRYGQINRIDINVKSEWNQIINDAYAMIEIMGPSGTLVERIKTPGETIEPFRTATLRGYWDTAGITPGDHQIIVTAVTEGGNETKSIKVTITASGIVIQDATARALEGGGMGIIGFALAFLIIANIALFVILFSRKKSKKVKK